MQGFLSYISNLYLSLSGAVIFSIYLYKNICPFFNKDKSVVCLINIYPINWMTLNSINSILYTTQIITPYFAHRIFKTLELT